MVETFLYPAVKRNATDVASPCRIVDALALGNVQPGCFPCGPLCPASRLRPMGTSIFLEVPSHFFRISQTNHSLTRTDRAVAEKILHCFEDRLAVLAKQSHGLVTTLAQHSPDLPCAMVVV